MNGFQFKGSWREKYFCNDNPLVAELGCGKGEYSTGLARKYPDKNFVGLDIKGSRLWKGCKIVEEEGLRNVAFIRTRIQFIGHFFGPAELDEIWLTFPDPQPKRIYAKKRLVSPEFLARYSSILKPSGIIHLKTDSEFLFNYAFEVIEKYGHRIIYSDGDVYNSGYAGDVKEITTFYEEKFRNKGHMIKYLEFQLKNEG